jgi:DNA-binding LacI/PurR family transcriptional regulator
MRVKVSIKDIARAAGVSHSTVSRALRDSPLVNADTKARIRRLAQEMGYSPDASARSLVMGRTQTIGVVVTTITDPFIAEVVQGIETTAYTYGYSVILASSDANPARELAAVDMLRSKRVDAVIVTSSRVGALYADRLKQIGVPVVLLNNHSEERGPYTYSVQVDDRHGAYVATEHLIGLGHHRIAYVGGAGTGPGPEPGCADGPAGEYAGLERDTSNAHRMAGYCAALRSAGIGFDAELVIPGTGRAAAGEQALHRLMSRPEPPTAVFCYNDMTAIGLLRAAREAGVTVPDELSVMGFDDIPFASYVFPPLTTIAQPKFELGQRAMQMASALIESRSETEATNVVLRGQLIVRQSTIPGGQNERLSFGCEVGAQTRLRGL